MLRGVILVVYKRDGVSLLVVGPEGEGYHCVIESDSGDRVV